MFDGSSKRGEAWVESDPVGPLCAYGRTKLDGERQVLASGAEHAIVRTAWVFGPGGRNFVDTMRRLGSERDDLQVVADQVGCPTFTGHLADALLTIADRRIQGIQHVAGGGACSWFDLALATFEATGTRRARHPGDHGSISPPRRTPGLVGARLRAPRRRAPARLA